MAAHEELLDGVLRYTAANIVIKDLCQEFTFHSYTYDLTALGYLLHWKEGMRAVASYVYRSDKIQPYMNLMIKRMKFLSWKYPRVSRALDEFEEAFARAAASDFDTTFFNNRLTLQKVPATLDDFKETLSFVPGNGTGYYDSLLRN
ncbi:hypothetical protein BT69DRAFT_1355335 [Atractiella rhizophila]|nr:hypothetical protein BT69DRAFT_1355335 [Atractiella rhizophila]